MVNPNELLTFIFATIVIIFLWIYRRKVKGVPYIHLLRDGYYCLYAGIVLTIMEGFFGEHILNLLEHALYATSSIFLACWIWAVFKQKSRCQ